MRFFRSQQSINIMRIATVGVIIALCLRYYRYLNQSEITAFIDRYATAAPVIFILLCSIRPLFFFLPTMGLTIVAGVLFGPLYGTIYVVIGGVFSTAVGFYFARWLGRGMIEQLAGINRWVARMDNWAKEHGRNAVLSMRLFNMPWDIVSYWAGISNVQFKDFYIASMIPIVPISFLYTYFGSRIFTPKSWGFVISIVLIFALGAIPFIKRRVL